MSRFIKIVGLNDILSRKKSIGKKCVDRDAYAVHCLCTDSIYVNDIYLDQLFTKNVIALFGFVLFICLRFLYLSLFYFKFSSVRLNNHLNVFYVVSNNPHKLRLRELSESTYVFTTNTICIAGFRLEIR